MFSILEKYECLMKNWIFKYFWELLQKRVSGRHIFFYQFSIVKKIKRNISYRRVAKKLFTPDDRYGWIIFG